MSPIVALTPSLASGSFSFQSKLLRLSGEPIFIGSADLTGRQGEPSRKAEPHNGWFGPLKWQNGAPSEGEDVYPLSLSAIHARIWTDGKKVFIRDMETAFGTFVNGTRIKNDMELKQNDIVAFGSKIPRNRNTPASITDDHLKPVIAVVNIS